MLALLTSRSICGPASATSALRWPASGTSPGRATGCGGGDTPREAAGVAPLLRLRLECFGSPSVQHEAPAALVERSGEGESEPPGGSGDDRCGHGPDGTTAPVAFSMRNWS